LAPKKFLFFATKETIIRNFSMILGMTIVIKYNFGIVFVKRNSHK
jgi:hypothetical protein